MLPAETYARLTAEAGQMRLAIQGDSDDTAVGDAVRLASYHLLVAGRELNRITQAAARAEEARAKAERDGRAQYGGGST